MNLLVKPEPFAHEFDRLFTRLFDQPGGSPQRWVPAMDLTEADDHFVLKADLPGLNDEDVSIEVQDDTLTISGERSAEHIQREKGWHRIERSFGRFSRALALPDGVNPDGVTAEFDRGVLTVLIPKPEERQPRRISIGVGQGHSNGQPAVEGSAEER
jgi:HSP20 family protein